MTLGGCSPWCGFPRAYTATPVVLMGYANPVEAMGWEIRAAAPTPASMAC